MVGRKTKRTPKLQESIFSDLANGLTRAAAARANGIHPGTLSEWCAEFDEFAEGCHRAEAVGVRVMAGIVKNCALESENDAVRLKAAQFYLSTRRREDAWVEQKGVEHSGALTLADAAAQAAAVESDIDDAMGGGE